MAKTKVKKTKKKKSFDKWQRLYRWPWLGTKWVVGRVAALSVWVLSFSFLMLILLQLALWGGFFWINYTEKGQAFLQEQVTTLLAAQGLEVEIDGLQMESLGSLRLGSFTVADQDGVLMAGRNLHARIGLFSLATKSLNFQFTASHLLLERFPTQERTASPKSAPPKSLPSTPEPPLSLQLPSVSLPDLFFERISLSPIHIDDLIIGEAITGSKIWHLSPEFYLFWNQSQRDQVSVTAQFQNNKSHDIVPDHAAISLVLHVSQDRFSLKIDEIEAVNRYENAGYEISMNGLLERLPDGLARLDFDGTGHGDLLTIYQIAPFTVQAKTEQIDSETAQISLLAESAYQNVPIQAKMETIISATVVDIRELRLIAPETDIAANLYYDRIRSVFEGTIKGDLSLKPYQKILPVPVTGQLSFAANFTDAEYQQIDASVTMLDGRYDDFLVPRAKGSLITQSPDTHQLSLEAVLQPVNTPYSVNLRGQADLKMDYLDLAAIHGIELETEIKSQSAENGKNHGQLSLSGFYESDLVDFRLIYSDLQLGSLAGLSGTEAPEMTNQLIMNGQTRLHGTLDDPFINAQIDFAPISIQDDAQPMVMALRADYENGEFRADLQGRGEGVRHWQSNLKAEFDIALDPFVMTLGDTTPVAAEINIKIDSESWARLLLPPTMRMSGLLETDLRVTGTLGEPDFRGGINLKKGRFSDAGTGLRFSDITLDAALNQQGLRLEKFIATDTQSGTITGQGDILFALPDQPVNIELKAERLDVFAATAMADGRISADFQLSGDRSDLYKLAGLVTIHPLYITLPDRFTGAIPRLNVVDPAADDEGADFIDEILQKIALAIRVDAPQQIFVRGWGLDAEFGGAVDISGTAAQPLFNGELATRRGRYEEFGRRFRLERAALRFQGAVPPSPYLDIVARARIDDVEADVILAGAIAAPALSFASQPAMPEDEILSYILFGRDMSALSPFQAIQLAQTLRRFTGHGGGGFDPISSLRDATGLDDLRYDMDEEGQGTIGIGKYLSDKVYLELQSGTGEAGGGARLEIELTPDIAIESELDQNSRTGGRVFWKWNY